MPLFLKGRSNYTRICEQCGKPFVKTARVQKKCKKCRANSGGKRIMLTAYGGGVMINAIKPKDLNTIKTIKK